MAVKESAVRESPLVRVASLAEKEHEIERKLRTAVKYARANGASWEDVAEALGITRQAAWSRFKRYQ